jgi:hypothetical protein
MCSVGRIGFWVTVRYSRSVDFDSTIISEPPEERWLQPQMGRGVSFPAARPEEHC